MATVSKQQLQEDAETLKAASAIMRKYFGGLETAIAILDEKSRTLTAWAASAE